MLLSDRPYLSAIHLWHKKEGRGIRPVVEKLGLKPGARSIAVKRALTDFGAEESFGQAAKRFKEHYGWTVERGGIRREVEAIALQAESFVKKCLLALETKYKNLVPPKRRTGWNRVLVELDGCQIRTGILLPSETEELTPLRRLKKRKRKVVFNFAKYLERFRQSVHYQKYQEWGLPIGSGEIESSHRYIPQKRLKIPGATWHPNMINPMLALRVIRANDWWSDFWQIYTGSEKLLIA